MNVASLDLAFAGAVRRNRSGLTYSRLTGPQEEYLQDDRIEVLWRDGNRLGKSYALAMDLIHRCRGTHPFQRTHRPPIRALVIGISLEQMIPLMTRIWELVPKGELSVKSGFEPGRGITGKPARLVFTSGPGKGSIINFATYKQGATRIAGGSYHIVLMDEPPTESMYDEVRPRILDARGVLRIAMTPTPDMPDQTWLRKRVETGIVWEHNHGLEQAHCWPRGNPAPWLFQPEIDEYERGLLPITREMRMRGAWEPVVTGRWLKDFGEKNVRDSAPPPGAWLVVGIDHGLAAGKQAAMLVAIADRHSTRPRVWWLDEEVSEGFTTPEHDAAGILAMLRRNHVSYQDVDHWVGDRPAESQRSSKTKSNRDLRKEIASQLGIPLEQTRPIVVPKKWAGSLTYGMELLNTLFARVDADGRPYAVVNPRCEGFRLACEKWAGSKADPLKDLLDAGRYPVEASVGREAASALIAHY